MRKSKRFACAALAMSLAAALTACGSPNTNTGSGGSNGPGAPITDNEELVIGISGAVSTLDTNQEAGILNYYIGTIVTDGLVALNNEGKVVPGLAESWDTEDYAVWTFKIRSDAKFSDGSPVTVEDIIWSIERAQDPTRSPGVSIYFPDYLQQVEKVDDTTLKITLEEPHPSFIWAISNVGGLFVTQKEWGESVTAIGSPQDLILGSGPYQVTEFAPGSHVSLEAQDYWWGGQPDIKKIRFDFITDDSTRLLAFTQGSIDFALNIPVEQGEQWSNVEGATVAYYPDRSYYGLTLDPTVEPFGNEHVRKAIAHSVNAAGIVDSILNGHGTVATAITPPEQFASAIDVAEARTLLEKVTHYNYDMEKAKEEFELSGEEPFETTLYYPDSYQNVGKASLVVANSLKEIGITVNVKEIPIDQWLTEVGNGEQGIAWMIYFATTAEPQEIAVWLLDGRGPGYNPANFTDEEIAGLTAKVFSQPAKDGIGDLLKAHDLAQKNAYYVPVWWGESAVAWGDRIVVTDFNSYTMLSENWTQHFNFN